MSETDEETRWLSKDALRELVEGAGGKWAASIGPKVDIVVLGDLRRERSDKKGDTWKGSKKADALAEQRRLSEPDAAGSVPRKRGPLVVRPFAEFLDVTSTLTAANRRSTLSKFPPISDARARRAKRKRAAGWRHPGADRTAAVLRAAANPMHGIASVWWGFC